MQPIIYWFRNDLRLYDNIALTKACESGDPIVFVYLFNEAWFKKGPLGFERINQRRLKHITNSLSRLNNDLKKLGSELYVFKGDPIQQFSKLINSINAKAVYSHHEYTADELIEEETISNLIPLHLFWGNMVYTPAKVPFKIPTSPFYYTRFMKKVINLPVTPPLASIKEIKSYKTSISFDNIKLPPPPNTFALDKMHHFLDSDALSSYHITRDLFEGNQYSSFLSSYLADGSLSANVFYQELNIKLAKDKTLEPSVTKLKQQLIWRDYYRFLFMRYGKKMFYKHGIRNKNRERYNDKETFDAWRYGNTNEPLINAFMNELRTTGFLSNRGRMLSSYYLSKVLQVNWLWGAAWFEYCLIDYDVCNNYGNWAYQSGVGTDSRFNRSFNLSKQMQKYDPNNEYINKWT